MIKRYLLFSGSRYYPSGGWGDFKGDFDSPDLAKAAHVEHLEPYQREELGRFDWYHVVDTNTWTVL